MTTTAPKRRNDFPYLDFIEAEGIPIHRALIGVSDVTALPREPWKRTGGLGTFIQLTGLFQCERGLYVGEIPARSEQLPQGHMYEEQIFILDGDFGTATVWQDDPAKAHVFEWERGSIFAIPPNCTYVLANPGDKPVVYMGVTTAPRVMNALFDINAVFDTHYRFVDLAGGDADYFKRPDETWVQGWYKQTMVQTRFIRNVYDFVADPHEQKVAGGRMTGYKMGTRFPRGHVSTWPSGRYHKAHYHGPGAIVLGLDGDGYVLAWDKELGLTPYSDGHGDKVVKLAWHANSIYVPPNAYFHQHFNTSPGEARHVAVYGDRLPLGIHDLADADGYKGHKSVKQGGTLIEYEDEDPQIRQDFVAALSARGIECAMPPVR